MASGISQEQQASRSKGRKIELVLQQLSSLPTLPVVAAHLIQLTTSSYTQAQEVVRLIESDPSLSSKIIAMATRAGTGLSRRSASLSKAVVLLGFDAVRNAVLSIKVFETFASSQPSAGEYIGFDRVGFWKHCLAVACASEMLIRHIDPKVDPEEAFVCGLLHDLGKIAFDTALPRSFARVVQLAQSSLGNIAEYEQNILGIDHTVAGKRLAEKWQLPQSLQEVIWLHHHWVHGLPGAIAHPGIVQTVYLADVLARQQRIGYSGNYYLPQSAVEVAGELHCRPEVIENIARKLPQTISERALLLGLDEIQPMELYHEALSQANSVLAKLNEQLSRQNQKLQLRSQYFQLLDKLASELKAGQSVVDVCCLITELWQEHIGCTRCATYALSDDELMIEGALKLTSARSDFGELSSSLSLDSTELAEVRAEGSRAVEPEKVGKPSLFLVDRTEDPDVISGPRYAEHFPPGFAVLPIGREHNWFFEQVTSMFDDAATVMMPLRTGEKLMGAILWQEDDQRINYHSQLKEIQAFAAGAALAIAQAQKQEKQAQLCEQLTQSTRLLDKAQHQLLEKRSLAAVGEMACGAAHEINNPLAVIVGRAQYLAGSEGDDERRKTLQTIARQGQLITQIISELLEFAQPSVPHCQASDVQKIINSAIDALREKAQAARVTFEIHLEDNLPPVFVDETQIVAALKELIANAVEAYDQAGGRVLITTRFDELANEVILEITDEGCGMNDQTLSKAFTPFFSAKPAGRRRGLGLSRCRRYIENSRGKVHLNSKEDHGSQARISLPVEENNPRDNEVVTNHTQE